MIHTGQAIQKALAHLLRRVALSRHPGQAPALLWTAFLTIGIGCLELTTPALGERVEPTWSHESDDWMTSVSMSADGRYLAAGSRDRNIFLFDSREPTPLWNHTTGNEVWEVSMSADGRYLAAGSWDDRVYLFEQGDPAPLWSYQTNGWVDSVTLSANGEILASGDRNGDIHLFHSNSTLLWSYSTGDRVVSLALSEDGRYLVAGSRDKKVYLFDRNTSTPLWTHTTGDWLVAVDISRDGRHVSAVSRDERVYLFDRDSPEPLWSYEADDWVISVAMSADGRFLAAGSADGQVYLFGKDSPVPLWSSVIGDWVISVALSADGHRLVAGAYDGGVYLYDRDGPEPRWYHLTGGWAISVTISDDGTRVAAGSLDHRCYYYEDLDDDGIWGSTDDFPDDPAASLDTDGDGYPDEWNEDREHGISITKLRLDDFPDDPAASLDTDGDGYPDEWNPGSNQGNSTDGLKLDRFPLDGDEWQDRDRDNIADNADLLPGIHNGQLLFGFILLACVSCLLVLTRRSRDRRVKEDSRAQKPRGLPGIGVEGSPPKSTGGPDPAAMQPSDSLRVLIVESDELMGHQLTQRLSSQGHSVEAASSSDIALKVMARDYMTPQVMLVEVHMAANEGLALIHKVRQRWPGTYVLAMIGSGSAGMAREAVEQGAFDVLFKPFRIVEVTRKLTTISKEVDLNQKLRWTRKLKEVCPSIMTSTDRLSSTDPLTSSDPLTSTDRRSSTDPVTPNDPLTSTDRRSSSTDTVIPQGEWLSKRLVPTPDPDLEMPGHRFEPPS